MITELYIENYKCFGSPGVTIPIRPVTFLYGKNSSGKSTVFNAIENFIDLLNPIKRLDVLNKFENFVNLHETNKTVRLGLQVDPSIGLHEKIRGKKYLISVCFEISNMDNEGVLSGISVELTSLLSIRIYLERDKDNEYYNNWMMDSNKIIWGKDFNNYLEKEDFKLSLGFELSQAIFDTLNKAFFRLDNSYNLPIIYDQEHSSVDVDDLQKKFQSAEIDQESKAALEHLLMYLCDCLLERFNYTTGEYTLENLLLTTAAVKDILVSDCLTIGRFIEFLLNDTFEILSKILSNYIIHTDPIRAKPLKNYFRYNGEYPIEIDNSFKKLIFIESGSESSVDYSEQLRNKVNFLFKNHLDPFGGLNCELNKVKISSLNTGLESEIDEIEILEWYVATPSGTLKIDLQNYGFGFSQLLPILVNCLIQSGKLILIEQPEVHLHPTLQADLCDILIQSAIAELILIEDEKEKKCIFNRLETNRNTVIIETHSEYFALRALNRFVQSVREKNTNKKLLPKWFCDIAENDIIINYFYFENGRVLIDKIVFRSSGEFSSDWGKDGFFPYRLKELKSILENKENGID